jgi:hypothetical protein
MTSRESAVAKKKRPEVTDEQFVDAIIGIRERLSLAEVADGIRVSSSTIERWNQAKNLPLSPMRPLIMSWIEDQLSTNPYPTLERVREIKKLFLEELEEYPRLEYYVKKVCISRSIRYNKEASPLERCVSVVVSIRDLEDLTLEKEVQGVKIFCIGAKKATKKNSKKK